SPSSDWEEVIRTPGMVILRPDEEYRLMVRNAATDKEVAGLSHLPSLKQLHLSGAKVTDAGLTPVGELTSLQQLAVSYCQEVTDVGLAVMERLVHLEHLELCSMNVTDTGLA